MCEHCGCNDKEHSGARFSHHFQHDHQFLDKNPKDTSNGEKRKISLEMDLLEKNAFFAKQNRAFFKNNNLLAVNIISSPGSGKTSLLTRTLESLREKIPSVVIEGDQQTELDAEKIRQTGTFALQIQTGKGCHLDAHLIAHALEQLPVIRGGIVWIENVGNLICPALFDLGESKRVVLLSIAEGDDKPFKYPEAFYGADLVILTKIDLLPYTEFSIERCQEGLRRIRPGIEVLELSSKTGEGFGQWFKWINNELDKLREKK
ncbi:hydrogenase nickel incorporation protein HypB [Methylacidiphilum caldifontis]|uniref:hydrogenase nickel incorporation protein HypB n=1 Tax=Methylacidiphilum caldifontis TaxID=2795386 RepID=UPI001A8FCEE9|nr:hydrogenase nickel incorporation protein HypB [Methylacidiphilum caldifontis]QSR88412.1 hydrogenase nickel incorporation protein HypB [Methylacidiphilum caldifontis]